jgi:hypothetical protein
MEESTFHLARVQVVEAMEQGLPGMRLQSGPGSRSVNRRPIGYASGCIKRANKRCAKADMDTRSTCEGKCGTGWNRLASKLLIHQATRSKRSSPSA